jgi:hypothetical protein
MCGGVRDNGRLLKTGRRLACPSVEEAGFECTSRSTPDVERFVNDSVDRETSSCTVRVDSRSARPPPCPSRTPRVRAPFSTATHARAQHRGQPLLDTRTKFRRMKDQQPIEPTSRARPLILGDSGSTSAGRPQLRLARSVLQNALARHGPIKKKNDVVVWVEDVIGESPTEAPAVRTELDPASDALCWRVPSVAGGFTSWR